MDDFHSLLILMLAILDNNFYKKQLIKRKSHSIDVKARRANYFVDVIERIVGMVAFGFWVQIYLNPIPANLDRIKCKIQVNGKWEPTATHPI